MKYLEQCLPHRWGAAGVLFLLGCSLVALARWRFLATPLERDEGEFAYGAQRILAGELPYVAFHAMKLPGIYFAYAGCLLAFGQSAWGIHLALLFLNLTSMALVFSCGWRLANPWTGAFAAFCFGLLTISPAVLGTQAQAEHFAVLPILLGARWLLAEYPQRWAILGAGIAFGCALLVKQHALFFGLAAIASCLLDRRWAASLLLFAGWLAPLAITCALIAWAGVWEPFVLWTWQYPRDYVGQTSWQTGWLLFRHTFVDQMWWCWPIWLAAAGGLVLIRQSPARKWLYLWTLAACASIMPGLYFRPHYVLFMAPVVALLAGLALERLLQWGITGRVVAAATVAWPVALLGWLFLPLSPNQLMARMYPGETFDAFPSIASYVAEHTAPDEPVAVLASEPQICFYAQRRSASPHIYMYPLMESANPRAGAMQRELFADLEKARPPVVIFSGDLVSWAYHPGAPTDILGWIGGYLSEHYYQVGRVDCYFDRPAEFDWDAESLRAGPKFPRWIGIFRRKSGH